MGQMSMEHSNGSSSLVKRQGVRQTDLLVFNEVDLKEECATTCLTLKVPVTMMHVALV